MSPEYTVYLRAYEINRAKPKSSREEIMDEIDIPEGFDPSELERVVKVASDDPMLSETDLLRHLDLSKNSGRAVMAATPRSSPTKHRIK